MKNQAPLFDMVVAADGAGKQVTPIGTFTRVVAVRVEGAPGSTRLRNGGAGGQSLFQTVNSAAGFSNPPLQSGYLPEFDNGLYVERLLSATRIRVWFLAAEV